MPTKPSAAQDRIPKIREAVIERVERTTLREVARQIGMTASGLTKFMAGGEPYRKIRQKLEAWYVRKAARAPAGEGVPSADAAAAAIRILAVYVPPSGRAAFVNELIGRMDGMLPPDPDWRAEFATFGPYMRAVEMEVPPAEARPSRARRQRTSREPPR